MSQEAAPPASGRLERFRRGLQRTREGLLGRVASLFKADGPPPDNWSVALETALIQADLGPRASERIVETVRELTAGTTPSWDAVREASRRVLKNMLQVSAERAPTPETGPLVVFVVGVNGGGKTTTAGKLAHRLVGEGKKVVLCGADTFRAAAAEQLKVWAQRSGAEFFGQRAGADPSAVIFDAARAAIARRFDALIVDTAGRLHTRDPLMRELDKMVRVVGRQVCGAPHQVLLVLDATTGQNAVSQAQEFVESSRANGLVLTKLDGTARGGVAIRIVQEMGIPLRYVGVGEGPDDLIDFDADEFLEGLLPSAA